MKIRVTYGLRGASRYDEQTGVFVGFCPALKIYSQGATEQEVREALESAVCLYLETCFSHRILHKVLSRAGFTALSPGSSLSTSEAREEFIKIEQAHFDRVFDMNVPLELVAAAALGGNNASSSSHCA